MDLKDTREKLDRWGQWWRNHGDHLGYPRINQIHALIQTAKWGVKVQTTRRHTRSQDIHVPPDIERIDVAISGLCQRDRALLVHLYQRAPGWSRKALERKCPDLHRALVRAEARIASDLGDAVRILAVYERTHEEPTPPPS